MPLTCYNMGHVVTFRFHSFGVNQDKKYTLLIKQKHIILLDVCEMNVGESKYSEPQVNLHKLSKSKPGKLGTAFFFPFPMGTDGVPHSVKSSIFI